MEKKRIGQAILDGGLAWMFQNVWSLMGSIIIGFGTSILGVIGHMSAPLVIVLGLGSFAAAIWLINGIVWLRTRKPVGSRQAATPNLKIGAKDATLKIGVNVTNVVTMDYYESTGIFGADGGKRVSMDIALNPSDKMRIDDIWLELWGKRFKLLTRDIKPPYELHELAPLDVDAANTHSVVCTVPATSAIDTKEARVHAEDKHISHTKWPSDEFSIEFGHK